MKKIICIVLAALLALCLVSCSPKSGIVDVSGDDEDDGKYQVSGGKESFSYEITELNTVRITGYTGSFDIHAVTVPAEIEGIEVTDIGPKAFYYANNVSSVTLPASVTAIGDWAFAGCSYLASVDMPSTVRTIGEGAFYNCVALKEVKLPEAITSLCAYSFYGCTALTSVDIPASVTEVGNAAFWGCTALTAVSGASGVKTVDSYAFNGCKLLASVSIPASAEVGEFAYNECTSLTK